MPSPISKKTTKRTVVISSQRKSKVRRVRATLRIVSAKPKQAPAGYTKNWEPMTITEFEAIMKRHGAVKLTPAESKRYRKILHPRE
jgi:hypothetical protein